MNNLLKSGYTQITQREFKKMFDNNESSLIAADYVPIDKLKDYYNLLDNHIKNNLSKLEYKDFNIRIAEEKSYGLEFYNKNDTNHNGSRLDMKGLKVYRKNNIFILSDDQIRNDKINYITYLLH